MRKLIMVIVCLMTMVINANAQASIIEVNGVSKEKFFHIWSSDLEEIFTKAYIQSHYKGENLKRRLKDFDIKYHKIKETAVRKFKKELIAPSQFILTNVYGDKIKVDDLDITEYKNDGKKYWSVLVTGDAKNNIGGYVHVNKRIDVYENE